MKTLIALALTLASTQVFAVAQADYKCGPYTMNFFGPEDSSLWSPTGEELGRWNESGKEPTFYRGNQLFLKWNGKTYRCSHLGSKP